MKPVTKFLCRPVVVLCLGVTAHLSAEPIYHSDTAFAESATSLYENTSDALVPILRISPVRAATPHSIPDFGDPLALGVDTGLGVFTGDIYHLDLLTKPNLPVPADFVDIELPPGMLRGIDILGDPDSFFLSYDGRAFDRSLLNIKNAEIIEVDGVPITSEYSPLSLMGFGIIIEAN